MEIISDTFGLILGIFVASVASHGVYYDCPGQVGVAALTFDDGPHSEHTEMVLDVLKENDVKATFFLLGPGRWEFNETRYVQTVQRMIDEGHQIGSHTWSHPDLKTLSDEDIQEQLISLSDFILKKVNKKLRIFRPPYGRFDERVFRIAQRELGYDVILWNVDTEDWLHKENTGKSLQWWIDVLGKKNGSDASYIGLHHDPFSGNTNLTQITIDLLRSENIRLTTVAECIGKPMYY